MVTLITGIEVLVDPPPAPAFTQVPTGDELVIPVAGPVGGDGPMGPTGPTGPTGPVGDIDEELPSLLLLFENGLI